MRLEAGCDGGMENDSVRRVGRAAHHLEDSHARSRQGWDVSTRGKAGKLMQRITKGTLRATEAWTDGRHAEDDKLVELDYELAVALANVTEGAARATVLKVTQAEPSHGFVARQALVDGHSPKSSDDPARALQPVLATHKQPTNQQTNKPYKPNNQPTKQTKQTKQPNKQTSKTEVLAPLTLTLTLTLSLSLSLSLSLWHMSFWAQGKSVHTRATDNSPLRSCAPRSVPGE